ncbi:PstS family phosphate ABC transporter substrate-binding protein [Kiritimatiellota bacterium B12222]|nr:PstS family phosphate ABC transporter substrate-binding protein [Kiritimatiellota bacterium B12222]
MKTSIRTTCVLLTGMLVGLLTGCTIQLGPGYAAQQSPPPSPTTPPSQTIQTTATPADNNENLSKAADAIAAARKSYDGSDKSQQAIQHSLDILSSAQQYDPQDRVLGSARYFYYRQLVIAELEAERILPVTPTVAAAAVAAPVIASTPTPLPTSQLTGEIECHGSDTMRKIMLTSAEMFRQQNPGVMFKIESKGSSSAPKAMMEGVADIGCMSRAMKEKEIQDLTEKYGQPPLHLIVGVDALAVFVHKDNPIKGLNLEQLDAIFSQDRLYGSEKEIQTWGDVGLTGDWKTLDIYACGRNTASGTYGVFKKIALKGGSYGTQYHPQVDSEAVISLAASRKDAIGYSGVGYKTSFVRTVPIAYTGTDYVTPTFENAMNGSYPMGRTLNLYVINTPDHPLSPQTKAFLEFILSDAGQAVVQQEGYGEIPPARRKQILESL